MQKKGSGEFDQPDRPGSSEAGAESGDGETGPSVGERLSETIREAGDSLRGSAERAGESVEDAIKQATERGKPLIDLLNQYAREQPLARLALAFIAGVALTSLLKR